MTKQEKRWVITNDYLEVIDDGQMNESLASAKQQYESLVETGEITLEDDFYIQEITLGKKYKLEQEPKWKEVTDD